VGLSEEPALEAEKLEEEVWLLAQKIEAEKKVVHKIEAEKKVVHKIEAEKKAVQKIEAEREAVQKIEKVGHSFEVEIKLEAEKEVGRKVEKAKMKDFAWGVEFGAGQ